LNYINTINSIIIIFFKKFIELKILLNNYKFYKLLFLFRINETKTERWTYIFKLNYKNVRKENWKKSLKIFQKILSIKLMKIIMSE